MQQVKAREVRGAFAKLKMKMSESTHHITAQFWYDGKFVLKTRLSHGKGDAKAPYEIRNQLGLDERSFADLIKCPLTRDGYVQILKDKGYI